MKKIGLVFILLTTILVQSIYADMLFYYSTAVLSAITTKITGPGEDVIVGRAHIGCLANARVDIYKVNNDGTLSLKWVEKTSSGETLENIGKFDLHIDTLEEETFYVYKASGGLDWDIDNDGNKDENATLNKGFIRAVAKGKDIVSLADKFRITVVSEILFVKTEQILKHQFDADTFIDILDNEAKLLMSTEGTAGDVNADGVVDHMDTLQYDSVNGKESLNEDNAGNMQHSISAIHHARTPLAPLDSGYPSIHLKGNSSMYTLLNTPFIDPGAIASDDRDPNIIVFTEGDIDTSKEGTYVRQYIAIDSAGNFASLERTIEVVSTLPSRITLNGDEQFLLQRDTTFVDPGARATDVSGVELAVTTPENIDTSTVGSYNIEYSAEDLSANVLSVERTIHVTLPNSTDIKAPIIYTSDTFHPATCTPGEIGYIEEARAYDDDEVIDPYLRGLPQPRYSPEVYGAIGYLIIKGFENIDFYTEGTYYVYWAARDRAGNFAQLRSKVTIYYEAPILWLRESNAITEIYLNHEYIEGGAYGYCNVCRDDEVTVTITNNVNTQVLGQYQVNYMAVSSRGESTTFIRTVSVVEDTEKPTISLAGASTITLEYGAPYVETANVYDNADRTNIDLIVTGSVNTHAAGTYILTYNATDSAGNKAIERQRTVIVLADTTAPVITLNGQANITLDLFVTYTDAGASAIDDSDGVLAVVVTGSVNTHSAGTYIITYNATDSSGNKAIEKKRTIIVLTADTTDPVVTLNGQANITIAQYATYTELGATAVDDRDGVLPAPLVFSPTVDTSRPKKYKLYYQARDKAGNVGQAIRIVTVVKPDTTPPRIFYTGDVAYSVQIGSYVRPNATATDNIDGAVNVSYSYASGVAQGYLKDGAPGATQGVYVLIYTAYDKAGNRSRSFRYIYNGLATYAVSLQAVMDRVRAVYGES